MRRTLPALGIAVLTLLPLVTFAADRPDVIRCLTSELREAYGAPTPPADGFRTLPC